MLEDDNLTQAPATETSAPVEQQPAEQAAPVDAPAQDQPASLDDTLEAVWAKLNAPRDEQGKFASTEAKTEEKQAEASPAPAGEAPKPPVSFPKEHEELWKTLADPVREYIAKREAEIEQGLAQKAEQLKPYEELNKVLEPWQQRWSQEGAKPAERVQQLLNAQAYLERSPLEAIQWLARSYGIDLGNPQFLQAQQPAIAPQFQALQSEIVQLKQLYNEQIMGSAQSEIQAFQKSGSAPYFDEVRTEMAKLVETGQAKTLPEAYEKAVWLVPSVRAKLVAEQAANEAKKQAEQAAKAKQASAVNVKGSAQVAGKSRSMEETLEQTANRLFNA